MLKYSIILILFLISIESKGQFEEFENLEDTSTKGFWKSYFKDFFKLSNYIDLSNPYGVNAGLNAETRFYNASGISPQQSPLYWFVSGNVTGRIYEWDIPVSFMLATDKKELVKPPVPGVPNVKDYINERFTRIGASPRYKWATVHLGHRTMDFSPLVMSSLPYFGVGTEINPGNTRIAFFKGRLADAKPRDLSLLEPNLPVFSRQGWGGKIGYGNSENYIDVMMLRGYDNKSSIPITSDFPITPLSNTVYSLQGRKQLGNISLEARYASSLTHTNVLDEVSGTLPFPFSLLNTGRRPSTVLGDAIEANASYTAPSFVAGLQYKRTNDGFQSVGIPFINTDVEEYNGTFSSQLLKGSLQYNLSLGVQRDNVSGKKDQTISRLIYAINANYGLGSFSIGLNYNNNEFSTDYLLSSDLDSLDAVVVTRNGGLNIGYNVSTDSNFGHSFQVACNVSDISDDLDASSAESTMYNATMTYGLTTPNKWNFNATAGYNKTDAPQNVVSRIMYGVGARKAFFDDKLEFNSQCNFYRIYMGSTAFTNSVFNAVAQLSYRVNSMHSFYSRANLIQRDNMTPSSGKATETIINLGYRMNFSYSKTLKTNENNEK